MAYNPSDGRTYHSDLKDAPRTHVLDNGLGPELDPFYIPGPKELEYCFKLGEWWRAIEEKVAAGEIVVQPTLGTRREHRLIGNTNTDVFFDATVEVRLVCCPYTYLL